MCIRDSLYALLKMAKDFGIEKVFVHCLMDGRDVSTTSGKGFIEELEQKMKEIDVYKRQILDQSKAAPVLSWFFKTMWGIFSAPL